MAQDPRSAGLSEVVTIQINVEVVRDAIKAYEDAAMRCAEERSIASARGLNEARDYLFQVLGI